MKIEFHRKTFVILGQLESMNKHEAWKKIQELGGYVSSTPRPSSDYIVIGKRPGKKLALVEKVKKPTLTEAQFLTAIEALEGVGEGQEEVGLNDAVMGLRELLGEEPSRKVWVNVQELLEQCTPEQLEIAIAYTQQHIDQWSNGDEHPGTPLPLPFEEHPAELRSFSVAWRKLALAGERSPLLRLGRSLDLSRSELRADAADQLLQHPDLLNLRFLNVGSTNWLDPTFFEGLRLSEHLPQLATLALHHLTEESAEALCGEHKMSNLRHVILMPLERNAYQGDAEKAYDPLFEAEWWEQIESLACCTSGMYGHSWSCRNVYPQLARHADRMRALRHLVLEDSSRLGELLQTALFSQIRRLSLALSDGETCEKFMAQLAEGRKEHGFAVLDLSRGIFLGAYRRPKKHAKPPQKVAIERLLQESDWGALKEVIVEGTLLGVRLKKKLDAWGEETGVTITTSPWVA